MLSPLRASILPESGEINSFHPSVAIAAGMVRTRLGREISVRGATRGDFFGSIVNAVTAEPLTPARLQVLADIARLPGLEELHDALAQLRARPKIAIIQQETKRKFQPGAMQFPIGDRMWPVMQ